MSHSRKLQPVQDNDDCRWHLGHKSCNCDYLLIFTIIVAMIDHIIFDQTNGTRNGYKCVKLLYFGARGVIVPNYVIIAL